MASIQQAPQSVTDLIKYATSLDPLVAQSLVGKQAISETKYDTLTFAAAAVPASTQFFANQSSDIAIKNFDGNGTLVNGGKFFLAQTLGVLIADCDPANTTAENIKDFLHQTAIRIQVDQKVMGTFPTHQLVAAGGLYVPSQSATTAAAAPAGATSNFALQNGQPMNRPFRLTPMLIEPLKPFAAYLIGPTGSPITLAGTLTIKLMVGGWQFQSIQ